MKLSRIIVLFLLFALLTPLAAFAQSKRTQSAADKSWTAFFTRFKKAVNQKDRTALKSMMASPFNEMCTTDGPSPTPDEAIEALDKYNDWKDLKKLVGMGTRYWKGKKTQRVTPSGNSDLSAGYLFKFENGEWLWYGCACYEC